MTSPKQMVDRVRQVMAALDFNYRECWVKGRLSPTWQARVPATFLSLAQAAPNKTEADLANSAKVEKFHSSKETIAFFNAKWANHVKIPAGKKLVSAGNYDDFRDHAVMALVDNGFAIRNTSVVEKNLNGKDTAYSVLPAAVALVLAFETDEWEAARERFLADRAARGIEVAGRISVNPANDATFSLHRDGHNGLQQQIIERMLPHFAPSYKLLYAGDTEERSTVYNAELIATLRLESLMSEKKPDVVAYDPAREWIFVVEAVTSTGHISPSRKEFFKRVLGDRAGSAVFITAFPDRDTFRKFAADMAWETEVWLASEPEHMIHFNGERFLGPY